MYKGLRLARISCLYPGDNTVIGSAYARQVAVEEVPALQSALQAPPFLSEIYSSSFMIDSEAAVGNIPMLLVSIFVASKRPSFIAYLFSNVVVRIRVVHCRGLLWKL
jgi:hypothetical protein